MKKIILTLTALIALGVTLTAQNMEMYDTDGNKYAVNALDNELKIEGMEGKVVFLEFFGLSCPACTQEMPHLINLQNKYPEKVKIMAIEVQKNDNDPINAYKKKHGINYTTFSNFDVGSVVRYIADKSGWDGSIPFLVAIDSKGNVQFTQAGILDQKELEGYVEKFSK
jgi:thiol-disulfide isomerase/thioredoxin